MSSLLRLPRLTAAGLLAAAFSVQAQTYFPTQGGNTTAQGVVEMCLDQNGTARACDPLVPRGVKIVSGYSVPPYPTSSSPITGNATGSTSAVVGTLAAQQFKTTYICGFAVSAIGGTAAVGPITIANTISSSLVYQLASSASGSQLTQTFTPCIPANAANTAITITTTADGSATGVDVNSWGFQL